MKNLKDMFSGYKTEDRTLSVETIDPQINDPVVSKLNAVYSEIVSLFETNRYNSTHAAYKDRNFIKQINLLDNILYTRFGFKVKHIATESYNYFCMPVSPMHSNVMRPMAIEYYDYWKKRLSGNVKKDIKEINSDYYDKGDILNITLKNMEKLTDQMNVSGVTVDNKKAYISGLPKDFTTFIGGDFYHYYYNLKATAEELTSVILHECGHIYTFIEYCYRTVQSTSILIDSVQENIRTKNKSKLDAMVIGYEEAFGEKPKSKKPNTVNISVEIIDRLLRDYGFLGSFHNSYIDSEHLADMFATRFGVGTAFVSNQARYEELVSKYRPKEGGLIDIVVLTLIISAWLTIIAGPVGAIFGLFVGATFFLGAFSVGVDKTLRASGYNDSLRRCVRVRNDLVRQIRLHKLDKEVVIKIMADIEKIDAMINMIPFVDKSIFEKLYIKYSTLGARTVELKETEQLIEDLMENDLYLSSIKLKNLAGGKNHDVL